MNKGAILSADGKYRYVLNRIWDDNLPKVAIIGLNPSTADATEDDRTINRCINFVRSWGYGGFYMLNLFAFRATDPKELYKAKNPIGEDNEKYILDVISKVEKVVCAWGNHGIYQNQNKKILSLIEAPFCLKISLSGEPRHPLYLKSDLKPIEYKKNNIKKHTQIADKIFKK